METLDRATVQARIASQLGTRGDGLDAARAVVVRHLLARLGASSRQRLREPLGRILDVLIEADGEQQLLDDVIDGLINSGDVLEITVSGAKRLALAPPMWVRLPSGTVFIVGGWPITGDRPIDGISTRGYFREYDGGQGDDYLRALDLTELPLDVWLIAPAPRAPDDLLRTVNKALDDAPTPGTVRIEAVLDAGRDIGYYKGRFVPVKRQSGRFLGRRAVKWRSSVWSMIQLDGGEVTRYIDLPVVDQRFSGRDEAWWVMHALDAIEHGGQHLHVVASTGGSTLTIDAPIPRWAERRLISAGSSVAVARPGGLASFSVPERLSRDIVEFLGRSLWLAMDDEGA